MTTQECEYLTYQLPATDIKLDELPEGIEQQVICLLYKNERYDTSDAQIMTCEKNVSSYIIDTFILKKDISSEDSEEKKYKYCLASLCDHFGYAHFIVYQLEFPTGVGAQPRVVGFNAYNVDYKTLGCQIVNAQLGKYCCFTITGYTILGYDNGNAENGTNNYILPPKSTLLQGKHIDIIDSGMSGILEIEKDSNSEYLIRELYFKDTN